MHINSQIRAKLVEHLRIMLFFHVTERQADDDALLGGQSQFFFDRILCVTQRDGPKDEVKDARVMSYHQIPNFPGACVRFESEKYQEAAEVFGILLHRGSGNRPCILARDQTCNLCSIAHAVFDHLRFIKNHAPPMQPDQWRPVLAWI